MVRTPRSGPGIFSSRTSLRGREQGAAPSRGAQTGKEFTGHDLGRTCARLLYVDGVTAEVIRKTLGHERVEMTHGYIGLVVEELQDAMTRAASRDAELLAAAKTSGVSLVAR